MCVCIQSMCGMRSRMRVRSRSFACLFAFGVGSSKAQCRRVGDIKQYCWLPPLKFNILTFFSFSVSVQFHFHFHCGDVIGVHVALELLVLLLLAACCLVRTVCLTRQALCKHFHFDLANTTKIAMLAWKKNNLRRTHTDTHASITYATVNMRSLRVTPALSRLLWYLFHMLTWNLYLYPGRDKAKTIKKTIGFRSVFDDDIKYVYLLIAAPDAPLFSRQLVHSHVNASNDPGQLSRAMQRQ